MGQYVTITTPQNVTLDYALANLGDRILAFLVDSVIKGAYIAVVVLIMIQQTEFQQSTLSVIGFILMLPVIFYSLLFELFNDGQTPGKRALNIKVVHLEGLEVSFSSYFLRWVFRIVDILMLSGIIGIITIAMSERGQRVGDIVANTTVISLKSTTNLEQSAFQEVKQEYTPVYPTVSRLNTKDIAIIKEVLTTRGEDAHKIKSHLSQKLESVLDVRKKESSETFLKQVIKDFNHIQQSEK